jgi:hypothetical protein
MENVFFPDQLELLIINNAALGYQQVIFTMHMASIFAGLEKE